MGSKTTPAQTDDQIAVLRAARANPDATPTEILDRLDRPHLTADYVAEVTERFHLPPDTNAASDSERGAALAEDLADDGGEDEDADEDIIEVDDDTAESVKATGYRCTLCGYEAPKITSLRAHVHKTDDAAHRDRSVTTDPHVIEPIGDTTDVLKRLNDREGTEGPVTDEHFEAMWYAYRHPEKRMDEIGEALGLSARQVRNRLHDAGIKTGRGSTGRDRRERIGAALRDAGILPRNGAASAGSENADTDTSGESGTDTPTERAEDETGDSTDDETDGESERVRAEKGNATYEGPAGGVDATIQYLSERPLRSDTDGDTYVIRRDKVWAAILAFIESGEPFTSEDLNRAVPEYDSESSALNVAHAATELGFLTRSGTGEGSSGYVFSGSGKLSPTPRPDTTDADGEDTTDADVTLHLSFEDATRLVRGAPNSHLALALVEQIAEN